jgi:SAM-dependent methyltransferase
VPLAASDLRALAIRTGAVTAYVSLGVVEHDPEGPDAILAEARRVLAPGGVLVVSVPYLNGARRLGAPWIRRRARVVAAAGGAFYQYAFSRRELSAALARHGFQPQAAHPYDPARLLRSVLPRPVVARVRPPRAVPPGAPAAGPASPRGRLARLLRRALYTEPALRLLGHMLLVVARRP